MDARPQVEVLLAGEWTRARASLQRVGDPDWNAAREAYAARFPSVSALGDPLVVLDVTWPERSRRVPTSAVGLAGNTPVPVDFQRSA